MPTRRDLANAIRALSMDAVQQANSGHPGMPMGMADIAEVLWNDELRYNPQNPNWIDRDRFVVSNGHGSMLLYSLLHLSGFALPIEELKKFRQLHSMTPGHPEYGYAPGVETTTGPLGQGLANAVGMALAERIIGARFNRENASIIDHRTYVFLGDGCLMEGISHEACSLAGTLGLGKLTAVYDDNGISIDGDVKGWFTDDTPKRFEAYGWHVIADVDGHDPQAVAHAFEAARGEPLRPTLICAKTVIGWGSPAKAGKESAHGSPLGADEVAATREAIGWPHGPFEIPDDIYAGWDHRARGAEAEADWRKLFDDYRAKYPDEAAELERVSRGELPGSWGDVSQAFIDETNAKAATVATRAASQTLLGSIGPALPELLGGSADLAGSNLTLWSGSKGVTADDANGNYVYYGVREFAMAAIMNGVSLHGGLIPYGGTFLMFSEYARNALRMAALMKIRSIYVFTHDSIGLGEDGPTHQAVEQAATLRLMPNMSVWRPADAVETAVAWRAAIERTDGPTSLLLSRQGLAHVTRDAEQLANVSRGGYIVVDAVPAGEVPQVIVIATGSEVGLALEAAQTLVGEGLAVRVVSMPCTSVFDAQTPEYKQQVLPKTVTARVAVEAGVTDYWRKYVGLEGTVIGVDSFGESAPAPEVFKHFGVTAAAVADAARTLVTND
ncbi:MAG: transketolase [Gammaproteobacteria bacterium]|jgi:transketolase